MLSRIAESLFWIGRYVERSDGTARILDVHLQLLLEDPWIEPPPYVYQRTIAPEDAPDKPAVIEIEFKKGDPIAIDGKP
ncbi:MAG: alpha-E domain-containing protein, partial [Actinomycetota bacterium]